MTGPGSLVPRVDIDFSSGLSLIRRVERDRVGCTQGRRSKELGGEIRFHVYLDNEIERNVL